MDDTLKAEQISDAVLDAAIQKKLESTPSFRYPLFELMAREHGLTLLDSELDEIIAVVKALGK